MSAVPQHGGVAGGLVLQAAQTLALGLEMDGQEHADAKERRWDRAISMTSRYATPMISAITNAVAPITGGMI